MITQEKIQKLLLFFVRQGGGGGWDKLSKCSDKLLTACSTQFRNTHSFEKSLTTVDDIHYFVKLA